jgi:antitoxin CptB|tara:strand:- start:43 stop:300 length:258 start_codon:yes stop_codon:yes gene_type:complete
MNEIKNLKKKIIYRAEYRGTKEMDLVLGKFVKKYINTLSNNDLNDLYKLLDISDELLTKSILYKDKTIRLPSNNVVNLLKAFSID